MIPSYSKKMSYPLYDADIRCLPLVVRANISYIYEIIEDNREVKMKFSSPNSDMYEKKFQEYMSAVVEIYTNYKMFNCEPQPKFAHVKNADSVYSLIQDECDAWFAKNPKHAIYYVPEVESEPVEFIKDGQSGFMDYDAYRKMEEEEYESASDE